MNPADYLAQGLPVIAVNEDKTPRGGPGWPERTYTEKDFPAGTGVALKLGPATGFIDIEEDGEGAADTWASISADRDLPPHPEWRSTRGVHRLFRLPAELFAEYRTLEGGKGGLDLLGRKEVGYVLIPPTGGREWLNDLRPQDAPELTEDQFFALFEGWKRSNSGAGLADADYSQPWWPYNIHSENWRATLDLLEEAGWTVVSEGEVSYLKRPDGGEPSDKPHNATFGGIRNSDNGAPYFYVFSTSPHIEPFEAGRAYQPFDVLRLLSYPDDSAGAIQHIKDEMTANGIDWAGLAADEDFAQEYDGPDPSVQVEVKPEKSLDEKFTDVFGSKTPRPAPDDKCYECLFGELALELADKPGVEMDPIQFVAEAREFWGQALGPDVGFRQSGAHRPLRGMLLVAGDPNDGRKGTTHRRVQTLFDSLVDTEVSTSMSSGEGLIVQLDRIRQRQIDGDTDPAGEETENFAAPADAPEEHEWIVSALMMNPEAGAVFASARRENSVVIEILNKAWEGEPLSRDTVKPTPSIDNHFLSFIGHIQPGILRHYLIQDSGENSFGGSGLLSRFQIIYVERTKCSRDRGQNYSRLYDPYRLYLQSTLRKARAERVIQFSREADDLLDDLYEHHYNGRKRAINHIQTNAAREAAVSGTMVVEPRHVEIADAFQRYTEASWEYLARDVSPESPDDALRGVQREVLQYVADSGRAKSSDVSFRFRNCGFRVNQYLHPLLERGLLKTVSVSRKGGAGRPTSFLIVP